MKSEPQNIEPQKERAVLNDAMRGCGMIRQRAWRMGSSRGVARADRHSLRTNNQGSSGDVLPFALLRFCILEFNILRFNILRFDILRFAF